MSSKVHEMIIIGSGPAGLTAAIYAARANLNPVIIAGDIWGGQLMNTSVVENFPGFIDGIMGPQLMMNMLEQAKKYGTQIVYANATEVDFNDEIKTVSTSKDSFKAKTVIVAVGSSPRKLDIPGEDRFWGRGVSTCATCDGALYKEKVVAVVGGGDSAMEEASFISKFAKKIYLIHRRDIFKASQVMQDRVLNNPIIEVVWDTDVTEIKGDKVVSSISLKNNKSNKVSELDVDGFFLAIGHIPNSQLFSQKLDLDEKGYIKVTNNTFTSVKGVFVAGDILDYRYQQAITAAGMGCMAALDAERYLQTL